MDEDGLMIPKQFFLTKGMGRHKEKLTSFEMALRSARIEKYNLVKVSSILPPGCEIVSREEGLRHLSPGEIVFYVVSENSSNEPNHLIGASIGLAVPESKEEYGYLAENHTFGRNDREMGSHAESLAAEMLVTSLGLEFDENSSWDEQKEYYRICGKTIETTNITQTAMVDKDGSWTTVLAAVVFIL